MSLSILTVAAGTISSMKYRNECYSIHAHLYTRPKIPLSMKNPSYRPPRNAISHKKEGQKKGTCNNIKRRYELIYAPGKEIQ